MHDTDGPRVLPSCSPALIVRVCRRPAHGGAETRGRDALLERLGAQHRLLGVVVQLDVQILHQLACSRTRAARGAASRVGASARRLGVAASGSVCRRATTRAARRAPFSGATARGAARLTGEVGAHRRERLGPSDVTQRQRAVHVQVQHDLAGRRPMARLIVCQRPFDRGAEDGLLVEAGRLARGGVGEPEDVRLHDVARARALREGGASLPQRLDRSVRPLHLRVGVRERFSAVDCDGARIDGVPAGNRSTDELARPVVVIVVHQLQHPVPKPNRLCVHARRARPEVLHDHIER
eukprot:1602940-Prymnesium_polylepis.1